MIKKKYIQVDEPDRIALAGLLKQAKGPDRTMSKFSEDSGINAGTLSRIASRKIDNPLPFAMLQKIFDTRCQKASFTFEELAFANGMEEYDKISRRRDLSKFPTIIHCDDAEDTGDMDKTEYTKRVSWDEYFMQIAELVKTRSTCMRRQVGAVIVKDNRIITTGYNGAPSGLSHCTELGYCERERLHVPSGQRAELCRAIHSEQNAIIQAAKIGVPIDGATIYITLQPCVICAKMIINSGIKRIVFKGEYPDELSKKILDEAGIELVRME